MADVDESTTFGSLRNEPDPSSLTTRQLFREIAIVTSSFEQQLHSLREHLSSIS